MPTYFLKTQFLLFVLTSFLLLNIGCKKSTTEPVETLALTIEDITCTEAWVKITTTNYQTPNTLTLFVNDKADQSITLVSSDTLLYVDSLLPNQSYKIKAAFVSNNQLQTTNEVVAKTMDSTTHNFSAGGGWQTFTFGTHSSSVLYDVAIIDENNIWVVGEIYMDDSLGTPDPIAYNVAHWNGTIWEVKKITVLFRGNYITPPLEGIYAFSSSDIWFIGSLPIHGDGNNWTIYDLRTTLNPNLSLSKAWGSNSSNIYFVGRVGSIAHYDGKNWQKIESGTTTNIYDVYGLTGKDGSQKVFCAASDFETPFKGILEISNNHINTLTSSIFGNIYTAWAPNTNQLYAGGHGLFKYANNVWTKVNIEASLIYRIRGDAVNNIFAVGGSGLITHFNGVNWQNQYVEASASFKSCDIKGKTIVAVGEKNSKAIIAIGKRN
ncbi:MAG: glucosyl transferase [Ignavibacteriaceae bacterium]|jgi:hypothetical protein